MRERLKEEGRRERGDENAKGKEEEEGLKGRGKKGNIERRRALLEEKEES